jgi:hypothetical protein
MDVQVRGRAARFADLLPGTFFCALRIERIYGICITDGHQTGALLFSPAPTHQSGTPWLASGGLPNDDLVSFPGAVLKPDPVSVSGVSGPIPFGAIINAGDKFYMRASNGVGNFITCNLVTGSVEGIPQGSVTNLYSKWQAGYLDEHGFESIFGYPLAATE